jgi:hypothetical protein
VYRRFTHGLQKTIVLSCIKKYLFLKDTGMLEIENAPDELPPLLCLFYLSGQSAGSVRVVGVFPL